MPLMVRALLRPIHRATLAHALPFSSAIQTVSKSIIRNRLSSKLGTSHSLLFVFVLQARSWGSHDEGKRSAWGAVALLGVAAAALMASPTAVTACDAETKAAPIDKGAWARDDDSTSQVLQYAQCFSF